MPLFNYKCPQCGRETEQLVRSSDDTVHCFNCEHVMEKQISAPYGKVTGYSYANGYSTKSKGAGQ